MVSAFFDSPGPLNPVSHNPPQSTILHMPNKETTSPSPAQSPAPVEPTTDDAGNCTTPLHLRQLSNASALPQPAPFKTATVEEFNSIMIVCCAGIALGVLRLHQFEEQARSTCLPTQKGLN